MGWTCASSLAQSTEQSRSGLAFNLQVALGIWSLWNGQVSLRTFSPLRLCVLTVQPDLKLLESRSDSELLLLP